MAAFYDLDPNAWYRDGITWALEKGVMNGVSAGQFSPNAETNRAMIVTMLWRMENAPAPGGRAPFRDVPAGQWYTDGVAWAAEQGLTLYQLMHRIHREYGYRKEGLVSVVRKGIAGAREIQQMMVDLRANPPKELCGSPVTKIIDAAGDVVSVRPSGTEPKIKFYFGAKGVDADAKIAALRKQFCE